MPFPSPGGLADLGIEPESPALQADSLWSEPQRSPANPAVTERNTPMPELGQEAECSVARAGRVPASVRCSENSQVAASALFCTFHVLHMVCVHRSTKVIPRRLCSQVLKLDSTPSPGMGNTCKSMADSCQCMTETTTIL